MKLKQKQQQLSFEFGNSGKMRALLSLWARKFFYFREITK